MTKRARFLTSICSQVFAGRWFVLLHEGRKLQRVDATFVHLEAVDAVVEVEAVLVERVNDMRRLFYGI